jgi:hypothetical protein
VEAPEDPDAEEDPQLQAAMQIIRGG